MLTYYSFINKNNQINEIKATMKFSDSAVYKNI